MKLLFTLASAILYSTTFAQIPDVSLSKSSDCNLRIIIPTVDNAVKLLESSFADFELAMSLASYKLNSQDGNYWAGNGGPSGCNFFIVDKKYDYVSFVWTKDKKFMNILYDELRKNDVTLVREGKSRQTAPNRRPRFCQAGPTGA